VAFAHAVVRALRLLVATVDAAALGFGAVALAVSLAD